MCALQLKTYASSIIACSMKRRRQPTNISGLPLHNNGHDNPVHKFKSVWENKSKTTTITIIASLSLMFMCLLIHVGLSRFFSGSTAYNAPNHGEDVAHLKMNLQLQKVTQTLRFTPSNQKCKPLDLAPYAHAKASIKHDEISRSFCWPRSFIHLQMAHMFSINYNLLSETTNYNLLSETTFESQDLIVRYDQGLQCAFTVPPGPFPAPMAWLWHPAHIDSHFVHSMTASAGVTFL